MDNTFKSPAILSLCPGFLGLERGLIRAIGNIRVVAYVEIETFVIANLIAAMEKGFLAPAPVWSDVKTLNGAIFRGKIDGIIGGYPCQPFSHAGQRGGTEDPRHLYPFISGIIKAAGPVWCFFENVAGHLTLGFPEVSADLRSMGYSVEAGIYSAEEAGAPQERDRLFILAIKSEHVANMQSSRIRGLSERKQGQTRSEPGNSINADRKSESELANTGLLRQKINEQRTTGVKQCSSEMAHSYNQRRDNEQKGFEQITKNGQRELPADKQIGNTIQCRTCQPSAILPTKQMGYATSAGQQECGQGKYGQLQEKEGSGLHNRPEQSSAGKEILAYARYAGLQRCEWGRSFRDERDATYVSIAKRSENDWPARPGEEQYGWEEPRTTFSKLGGYVDGNPKGIDILYLNETYEIYTAKKERAIKALHELWLQITKESIQWTFGGLFNILEKEILYSEMLCGIQNKRISLIGSNPETILSFKKINLRELWGCRIIEYSSQRQECFEQLRNEFADAMCILSYEITLARRQEPKDGSEEETMQYLWNNYADAWWDVPETLSEIQKVWKPFTNQTDWRRCIAEAYKCYRLELFEKLFGYNFREDLLRAYGNSVVEQTAEIAFLDLLSKHMDNAQRTERTSERRNDAK